MEHLHTITRCKLWRLEHLKGDQFAAYSLSIPPLQMSKPQKVVLVTWLKPEPEWMKLNTDGASRGNPGVAVAGGLLRNHKGEVLWAFFEPLGTTTNTVAELQALFRGLQISLEKGFPRVWIELDALNTIHLLSAQFKGVWHLQVLLQKIKKLLLCLETKVTHIYREGNQAADYYANLPCSANHFTLLSKEQINALLTLGFHKLRTPSFTHLCVETLGTLLVACILAWLL
ncbi:UNVERIFIED_CONTAM: putative ribonuclease H protein [Sesamum latifolium]|uniref:Ribonuclease H protein n=1 Tax=Sesamum latifolium TaxID=2727402 RepID=A0AAW2YAW3_9LAMI